MGMDKMENKLNLSKSLKNLLDITEEFKGMLEWRAEVEWHYFVQLLDKGFNEKQATEIVSELFKKM